MTNDAHADALPSPTEKFPGWTREPAGTPKMAALLAAAQLPAPAPVAAVGMVSSGHLLIVGDAATALGWAERLYEKTALTVLLTGATTGAELPVDKEYDIVSGRLDTLSGHLGAFEARWRQANAIDLDLCTRCNACIDACPERAIGFDYQVESIRCMAHRACIAACPVSGAIDFQRRDVERSGSFDLVLDLSPEAVFRQPELPTGYAAPGRDPLDQALAIQDLLALSGEFEKPRYVSFAEKKCAHSRAKKAGCNNCIDVCATLAIRSAGDKIEVDPFLCQGCGTCSTVCPTGALSYQFPRVADLGRRIKTMLTAYRAAGGDAAPALLFHSAKAGRTAIDRLARHGKGLPPHVIPVETWSADAIGLDLMLGALALGATQVAVLAAGSHDAAPLRQQAAHGQTVLSALGYGGEHIRVLDAELADDVPALEDALWNWPRAIGAPPAEFHLLADKRKTLEFAVEHFAKHAPTPQMEIALKRGAPFGGIFLSDRCTLCNACASVCPPNAITAAADAPRLHFLEASCVQCGLCARSCPENAIDLQPRLLVEGAGTRRVLREAEVFGCTSCGKPMGARTVIEAMLGKLAGHSMFAGEAERARLSMCSDCRVVDLIKHEKSSQAWEIQ